MRYFTDQNRSDHMKMKFRNKCYKQLERKKLMKKMGSFVQFPCFLPELWFLTKYSQIVPSLLAAHAFSGCDTVPKLLNVGKNKIFKELGNGRKLLSLGNKSASLGAANKETSLLISS